MQLSFWKKTVGPLHTKYKNINSRRLENVNVSHKIITIIEEIIL
jgi:hypothetical protein